MLSLWGQLEAEPEVTSFYLCGQMAKNANVICEGSLIKYQASQIFEYFGLK